MPKPKIPESARLSFTKPLESAYSALIALPSCNESKTLPEVISSLEKNNLEFTDRTLLVVNINNRSSVDNSDNLKTLSWLQELDTHLHLGWLENFLEPHSYPEKFGVGLARHQAVSAGLQYIHDTAPVISLDGDSPVNKIYLREILNACESGYFQAGHVNFEHKLEGSEDEIRAIQMYDRHLHLHRKRLQEANSPHAWYAIGSTIVCTKAAYLKAGGYNVRKMAGEDFYLLQQLSKTGCSIKMIGKAFVYPSNRPSDRVPFGTGKAVQDILDSGNWHTYNPACYNELYTLLKTVKENLNELAGRITESLSEPVCEYLASRNFASVWEKLQRNSKNEEMLLQRFNEWLDAFQTLKLIHHLSEIYPKEEILLS